jgi:ATP adenylyltransferase
VTLDRLWAGWRASYVADATERERAGAGDGGDAHGAGCVFCHLAAEPEPSAENLVVFRDERTFVALNKFPYGSGHLLVLPVRHVGDLAELDDAEAADLWATTLQAVAAVRAAYDPDGVNMGANLGRAAGAGIPSHLHLHVLPRWSGDTNFMTSVAETRVLSEPLEVGWERLRAAWPAA